MKNEYSNQEIVTLILNFYTSTQGYWEDEVKLYTEIQKFIEDGYTCYDDKYPELIKSTDEGYEYLHCRIEEISKKYIGFMMKNGMECSKDKVAEWFMKEFELDDIETGEEIARYITCNLYHYGYKAYSSSSRRKGNLYNMIKMD